MAVMATSLLPFLFLLAFSVCIQSSQYVTTVFDVSASIENALGVFSSNHSDLKPTNLVLSFSSNSSFFSLSLYPRSSLYSHQHEDYESLVLSRLARDSARVSSIQLRIDRVYTRGPAFWSKFLTAPLTSGQDEGSGEYFAKIGIGWPIRYYDWVIDTGSDVSWLQCLPCTNCYKQTDAIYDPSKSLTYRPLPCRSAECEALRVSSCRRSCRYGVSYGDGSFTIGNFATELLWFGFFGPVNDVAVGCGHDNEGLFSGAAGIIGLGGGPLSLPSQLRATSFSYCLVDGKSTRSSTLEFNSLLRPSNSVTAMLVRNTRRSTYRYVELIGVSVGGRELAIPPSLFAVDANGLGGTIIDSGTSVTRLATLAYDALRDEFVRQSSNLLRTSRYSLFDTCYDLSGTSRVAIPTVSFIFGRGQILMLPPESILLAVDSNGKFCLAFAPTMRLSIIGNIQQQTTRVTFDLANSLVEFSPKQC